MAISDIVNTWFRERIAAGAVARDTDAYNQVHAALADLIDRIDAGEPDSAPAEADQAPAAEKPAGKTLPAPSK